MQSRPWARRRPDRGCHARRTGRSWPRARGRHESRRIREDSMAPARRARSSCSAPRSRCPRRRCCAPGRSNASLDAGNLRHIRLRGREAIRAISYIVRDRNWGTYNPEITEPADRAGRGRLSRSATTRSAATRSRPSPTARGSRPTPSGNLSFEAEGEALDRLRHQPHRLRRPAPGRGRERRAGRGRARRRHASSGAASPS